MSLDYWELVTKSLRNAWDYKFLWLFGFFAAGSEGFGHIFSNIGKTGDRYDLGSIGIEPFIIVWLALAAVFVGLMFFIMAVLSEGAMIHGIVRKESNSDVTFGECWGKGIDKFWRLFVMIIILTIAVIFFLLFLAMFIVPAFFAHWVLGIVLVVLAIPVIIAAIFVTEAVTAWAIRFAVIEDCTWIDSFSNGWKMLKDHFGKTFAVALSSVLTQIVGGIIVILVGLILAIPFVILGLASFWLGVIPGALFGLIVMVLVGAYFGVFQSSIWTLAFMKIRETATEAVQISIDVNLSARDDSDSNSEESDIE